MDITNKTPTTFMKAGGWCWFQDPRAVIVGDQMIIGGISGRTGDVRVGVYDLEGNTSIGEVVLHPGFERDDHNTPAFYARPDGRLLAVYAKHACEPRHYFRLSEPGDFLDWGPETTYEHPVNENQPTGVTYMNLYTSAEQGRLYNFFRNGPDFNPWFISSDDHGETWGHRTHFIDDGLPVRARPYTRYVQRDEDTIGVTFTEAHPRDFGNSLYYAQIRNGFYERVDGTRIKALADGPLLPAEADLIYRGSGDYGDDRHDRSVPNAAWTSSVVTDRNGWPHIGYSVYLSHGDLRYRIASWDGQRWNDREVADAGGFLYPIKDSYTGLITLDPNYPMQVVISTDADPRTGEPLGQPHQLFVGSVGPQDHRETISWRPLNSDSDHRQIRPMFVTGGGYRVLLWMRGRYTTFQDYDVDIAGHVLERPTASA
ncbi:MAG: BNR-4 repeat-containing protein [Planctomycetota bacterium]